MILSFPYLVVILTTLKGHPRTSSVSTTTLWMTTLNKTRPPGQEQVWLYFICGTTRPGYMGTTMNLQIILNTQKNPYLNQATQKNTCQIFIPKKIPESKISNPKNPSIIPVTWSPEYPPLGVLATAPRVWNSPYCGNWKILIMTATDFVFKFYSLFLGKIARNYPNKVVLPLRKSLDFFLLICYLRVQGKVFKLNFSTFFTMWKSLWQNPFKT